MSKVLVPLLFGAGVVLFTAVWWEVHRPARIAGLEARARAALATLGPEAPVDLTLHQLDATLFGIAASEAERERIAGLVREACPALAPRLVNCLVVDGRDPVFPPDRRELFDDLALRLASVQFSSGRDRVGHHGLSRIRGVAERLRQEAPTARVLLIGRTDGSSSSADNFQLGLRRARFVRGHLSGFGFPAHQVGVVSLGETGAHADDPAMRRVDLLLVDRP